MAVRDWMSQVPITAGPGETVREAFLRMCRFKVENLPVTGEGEILGMINGGAVVQEVVRRGRAGLLDSKVEEQAVQVPVVDPGTSEEEALLLMEESGWRTLPVVEGGQVVGVVSEEDLYGAVLERCGLGGRRRASGKPHRRFPVLLDLTREASAARDLAELIEAVGRHASPLVPLDRAMLLLPEGGALEVRAAWPTSPLERRVPLEGTPAGLAWRSAEGVRVADLEADRRFVNDGGPVSRVCLPLCYRGGCLGVLEFASLRLGAYTDRDMETLELVAGQVSAAVNTAHRLEAEQRLVGELREAQRVKDEFLALVTHDLKNSLMVMLGYSKLLGRPDLSREQMAAMADSVSEQTVYMSSLVNDVHDLARLGTRALRLHPDEVEVGPLIGRVLESHLEQAREAGVELEGACAEPLRLRADAVRLRQVLDNLVSNAIKYNRPGGRVCVRCSRRGSEAVLEVEDTGIGVPPEQLGGLFQLSGRLPGSGRVEGSGLGLYITRMLVELHGGGIEVESEPGRGSTFRVALPVGGRPDPEHPAGKPAHHGRGD